VYCLKTATCIHFEYYIFAVSLSLDVQGIEDALGHMDFKMAGTKEGITSIQVRNQEVNIN